MTPLLWLPELAILCGEEPEAVCASVGLDYAFRENPTQHIPLRHYAHILGELDRRLKLPGAGVMVSGRSSLRTIRGALPVARVSESVGEFLFRLCEAVTRTLIPGTELRLRKYRDRCLLYIEAPAEVLGPRRVFIEYYLPVIQRAVWGFFPSIPDPGRVLLCHRDSIAVKQLEQVMQGAELVFSARFDGIEFPAWVLDEPGAIPPLDEEALRRAIYLELVQGRGNITQTASFLGISERTLQRRLSAQGLTYRRLLLNLRMDLAARYLTTSKSSVESIARHLSYTHHSDFTRAFKKRFGITPTTYRSSGLGR